MATTTPAALSIREFSQAANISDDTTRRRIADGTIQAFRVGKRLIRIPASELDKLMRPIPSAKVG